MMHSNSIYPLMKTPKQPHAGAQGTLWVNRSYLQTTEW